jgi:hypothetical protein
MSYWTVTEAIKRMMYKRYERLHDKVKVKQSLEHLKRDTWKNNKDICNFIDQCMVELKSL